MAHVTYHDDKTPLRVLSFGAGVQSSTLLRMALAGDIPPVDHVIFADTGWEPAAVYDHMNAMRELVEAAGVGFHVVSAGNIRADVLDPTHRFASVPVHVVKKGGKPAMGRRQCTSEYKIKPLVAKQRELAGLKPRQRSTKVLIETLIGISLDEVQRMKDPLFPWITNTYPLVDLRMTRQDCIVYHERRNLPRPPRSACLGCPFHSDHEWRAVKANPDEWADVVDFDNRLRNDPAVADRMFEGRAYLHPSRIPLADVDLSTEEHRGQLSMFDMECEGMCGL
jgi:hypothetical protein